MLDADDTTLWTYDMEDGAMHFNFDPALQNTWVQDQKFPAVAGMADFVDQGRLARLHRLRRHRPHRHPGARDPGQPDQGRLRHDLHRRHALHQVDARTNQQPAYITCATAKCTTVEYKAGTRKHIESLGYNIVLNVGDQWSDLKGGYADRVLKLPNPTYYLPSPNLPGVSEPALDAEDPLHDGAGRLERRHRGR